MEDSISLQKDSAGIIGYNVSFVLNEGIEQERSLEEIDVTATSSIAVVICANEDEDKHVPLLPGCDNLCECRSTSQNLEEDSCLDPVPSLESLNVIVASTTFSPSSHKVPADDCNDIPKPVDTSRTSTKSQWHLSGQHSKPNDFIEVVKSNDIYASGDRNEVHSHLAVIKTHEKYMPKFITALADDLLGQLLTDVTRDAHVSRAFKDVLVGVKPK